MSGVAALPQSGIRLSVTLSSGDRRTGPGWAGHTPVSPLACSHRGSLLRCRHVSLPRAHRPGDQTAAVSAGGSLHFKMTETHIFKKSAHTGPGCLQGAWLTYRPCVW